MPGAGFAPARQKKKTPKKPENETHQNAGANTVQYCMKPVRVPSRTLAPKCDTLLLVSLADAVVTVAIHVLAGVAVMQVDVGGAVRAAAGAELRKITGVAGFAARRACRLQLHVNIHDHL